ncbi:MAG: phosphoenolpyruvate synthase [Gammaproteobacteria bacterium]|nr:phosphoenolpyruvate synthase [Gammaproteobacteria bacterium]
MKYVKFFSELGNDDVALVGGKNASLGEMYRTLSPLGVRIPNGFATTAQAFNYYLEYNNLTTRISDILGKLDLSDVDALAATGAQIRHWITLGEMPADLAEEIRNAYHLLENEYGENPDVAVRSSATAEDLPTASFAGQQETFLNIRGSHNLIKTCQQVFASLYTNRAISYRVHQGFDHIDIALSAGIQKMVRSDSGASGVIFTLDTESGFRDVILITSSYGLGENVVKGAVNPDEYYVFKPTLESKHRAILKRQLGDKAIKMVYTRDPMAGRSTRNVEVAKEERDRFAITDNDVLELACYALTIEKHYSKIAGKTTPMDIEWAKDGESGELFIVQARPETVQTHSDILTQEVFRLTESANVICTGKSVGTRISSGKATVILDAEDMHSLKEGEILVTDITDPDWEPVMKKAAGIITNRGGRTCHAAIVARELGIPAIVGCGDATQKIESGDELTISCAEGDTAYVYEGLLKYEVTKRDLTQNRTPNTKLMVNLGNPEHAFETSRLPAEGVGLARLEFIISNSIQIHPKALLQYHSLSTEIKNQINEITAGYADKVSFYIDRLTEGVGMIAAAFYPKPVIVRLSDFKSNEYASLIGGKAFEPVEENPMIGFRGAARYPSENFSECFALECEALRRVREDMGLDNVAIMVPFVRNIEEGKNVIQLLERHGLKRGDKGLKLYLMCEIPANALLADEFLKDFDGFSIGSNDLTQLTLGVDRDSGIVAGFDERNPAVLKLMKLAIDACKRQNKYIGICGQAPSDYPEITQWLVQQGIDSISLNPDSLLRMREIILKAENITSMEPGM